LANKIAHEMKEGCAELLKSLVLRKRRYRGHTRQCIAYNRQCWESRDCRNRKIGQGDVWNRELGQTDIWNRELGKRNVRKRELRQSNIWNGKLGETDIWDRKSREFHGWE
jgi:hypothetical protein